MEGEYKIGQSDTVNMLDVKVSWCLQLGLRNAIGEGVLVTYMCPSWGVVYVRACEMGH